MAGRSSLGAGARLLAAVVVGCSTAPQSGSGDSCPDAARCDEVGVLPDVGVSGADGATPMPDAFVSASVGPANDPSACGYSSDETFLQIGAATIPQPVTFTSGELQSTASTVSLSCKVDPSGSGFNVQLSAEVGGPNGGSVSVGGLVTTEGGHNIQGTVTSATGGSFTEANCSISFTYNGNPVPVMPPIAAGRIWGHLDCPEAMAPATPVMDGGPATCAAQADFLFQNCE